MAKARKGNAHQQERALLLKNRAVFALFLALLSICFGVWRSAWEELFPKKSELELHDLLLVLQNDLGTLWRWRTSSFILPLEELLPPFATVFRLGFVAILLWPKIHELLQPVLGAASFLYDMYDQAGNPSTRAILAEGLLTNVVQFTLVTVKDKDTVRSRDLDLCTLKDLCLGDPGLVEVLSDLKGATTKECPLLFEGGDFNNVTAAWKPFHSLVIARLSKQCMPAWLKQAEDPSAVTTKQFYFTPVFEHAETFNRKLRVFLLTEESLEAIGDLGDRIEDPSMTKDWQRIRWNTLWRISQFESSLEKKATNGWVTLPIE
jgi:hypothetical protein